MNQALVIFRANIQRVRAIHALHASIALRVTSVVDLSDLLRAEIVLIVSALDHFVHEITRAGMLEIWNGSRAATPSYLKFPVSLDVATHLVSNASPAAYVESEIRTRHGFRTFQQPDDIADAIRMFSSIPLWKKVAAELSEDPNILKARLKLIIERRNKIAHEADIDPSYPGQRWPIVPADVEGTVELVEKIGEAIHRLVA